MDGSFRGVLPGYITSGWHKNPRISAGLYRLRRRDPPPHYKLERNKTVQFRVVIAGESAIYVHTRTEPLTAGDRFKITPDSPDAIRVRHFAFDPVGPDSPEMLIVADRVM